MDTQTAPLTVLLYRKVSRKKKKQAALYAALQVSNSFQCHGPEALPRPTFPAHPWGSPDPARGPGPHFSPLEPSAPASAMPL